MNGLELDTISLNNNIIQDQNIELKQNNFLESILGKTINSAVDIGIKAILPDIIEDEVINIKDAIMTNGFKDGLNEIIDSTINTGKSAIGIVTGEFENVSQIEMAVRKGGLLDKTSKLLDIAINFAREKQLLSKEVSGLIMTGKNTIINSVSDKIEKTLTNQIRCIERIEKYCEKWQESFNNKDINQMDNSLRNIKTNLEKIVPLENIINRARTIETLHSIIKNTGSFDISTETMELATKLN